jgi:hypothetical protein
MTSNTINLINNHSRNKMVSGCHKCHIASCKVKVAEATKDYYSFTNNEFVDSPNLFTRKIMQLVWELMRQLPDYRIQDYPHLKGEVKGWRSH